MGTKVITDQFLHGNYGNRAYRTIDGKVFMNPVDTGKEPKPLTRNQQIYHAEFSMANRFVVLHYGAIKKSFDKGNHRTIKNAFMDRNLKPLREALHDLAINVVDGRIVTDEQIEQAVKVYAEANPQNILIGNLPHYKSIYLTGEWPMTFKFELIDMDGAEFTFQQSDGSFGKRPIGTPEDKECHTGNGSNSPQSPDTELPDDTTTQVVITAVASPAAGGTVTGGGSYAQGTQVTLKATANSGYTFSRWSDGNTSAQCIVTASADATYTAQFTQNGGSSGGSQGGYDSGN